MALRAEYLIRETGTNLRRNILLTIAAILTVAVCLSLLGVSVLIADGANSLTQQWKGGIEFIVFMKPDATPDQNAAIKKVLDDPNSAIKSYKYLDKNAAYQEFKQLFSDKPDLIDSVTPDVLPPSYRVVPVDTNADAVAALGTKFDGQPGVREVRYATDVLRNIESATRFINLSLRVAGVVLLGVAVLLILNTISTAMASRRREIEVMKLVGATNWFIRVPFMLEGLVHGVVGAGIAVTGLAIVKSQVFPRIQRIDILQYFHVTSSQVWTASIWLMVIGCVVGVIGSLWAVSRYLDV